MNSKLPIDKRDEVTCNTCIPPLFDTNREKRLWCALGNERNDDHLLLIGAF